MNYRSTADPQVISQAYQLDFFQEPPLESVEPVKTNPNFTKLPESLVWSDTAIRELEEYAIAEAWPDFLRMISNRLKIPHIPLEKINARDLKDDKSLHDYQETLGWVMRLWVGSISLDAVLAYENADCDSRDCSDKTIEEILNSHPVLRQDCQDLKAMYLQGGALFAQKEDLDG